MDGPTAIAVLAAGGSRRFGSTKQLARIGSRALVRVAVDVALDAGVGPVICVVGARAGDVADELPDAIEVVVNPHWAEGLSTSVAAAIERAAPMTDIEALCIGLGDQPLVGPDAYRRLVDAHRAGARIAVATYGGERRNPVLIDRSIWATAALLEGDVGLRQLMDRHTVTEVTCDDTGSPEDVDTVDDLDRVASRPPAR